jgi:hypothetical protein
MITRRTLLATFATAALLQGATVAYAATPVEVKIVALGHWPVQKALDPVRALLETYGDKVVVQEFDAEADDGVALIEAAGKQGHVPLIILINGAYQFTLADGTAVEFFSFPSGAANPLGGDGSWSVDNLKTVLDTEIGG